MAARGRHEVKVTPRGPRSGSSRSARSPTTRRSGRAMAFACASLTLTLGTTATVGWIVHTDAAWAGAKIADKVTGTRGEAEREGSGHGDAGEGGRSGGGDAGRGGGGDGGG